MKFEFHLPDSMLPEIDQYTVKLYYRTGPLYRESALRHAILQQLEAADIALVEELIKKILEDETPEVVAETTPEPIPEPTPPEPPVAKQAKVVPPDPQVTITDPKKLRVPEMKFQNKTSNIWLVWGFMLGSNFDKVSKPGETARWHQFTPSGVLDGVYAKKRVKIKLNTIHSALSALEGRQWIRHFEDTKKYELTEVARAWLKDAKNQAHLIDYGFLSKPAETY